VVPVPLYPAKVVRQDNALDAETVLNQQANAQMTYSGKFGTNKSLTLKTLQQYNLTRTMERQIPDVHFRMSGPLFDTDSDDDDAAADESFLIISITAIPIVPIFIRGRALDSIADKDTTAWYIRNIRIICR
jgi:hypothetical protein